MTAMPAVRRREYERVRSDAPLGPRLTDCLYGLNRGLTDAEIAAELGVAVATVKTHLRRLFDHLGARNRCHAVSIGYARGLLRVDAADPPVGPPRRLVALNPQDAHPEVS